jgi:hypothetical protein
MRFHRAILNVVVTLAVFVCPVAADQSASPQLLSGPEAAAELARLQDLWKARRSEIHSCDIRYRVYYSLPVNPPLTIEQFEQRLDEYGLRTSPARSNEFVLAICPSFKPRQDTRRLVREGHQGRYEVGNDVKVHDGELQLDYSKFNKSITIRYQGQSNTPVPPIDWLREIPPALKLKSEDAALSKSATTVELKYDTQLFTKRGTLPSRNEFLFDATSGVTLHRHYLTESQPTESLYQLALVTGPDGVVFPSCSYRVMYDPERTGLINRVNFTEIVDAQFNRPNSLETFSLPKPRGVAVFDTRKGDKMLDLTDEETKDTRRLIIEPVTYELQPTPIPWQRRAFFIVNGLILIGLGVWLWRRVSLKEPKR